MDAFLHRHERKAIDKKRKRDRVIAAVPAYHGGHLGVLAVTSATVYFAARRGVRTPVLQWPRTAMKAMLEPRRYGILVLAVGGQHLRFELTRSEDKHKFHGNLLPRPREVDPVKELTRPRDAPRPRDGPGPDPLGHRGTPEHRAMLQQLVEKGVITEQEMQWQLQTS